MSNLMYATAKEHILSGVIDWVNDDVTVVLLSEDYVFNATDKYLQDIPSSAIIDSGPLANKAITDGKATADALDIIAVTSDDAITQVVVYQDTGDAATSTLITYVDTSTDLPRTPDGSDISITWDANGVFSL